jgi:hypothetical protein
MSKQAIMEAILSGDNNLSKEQISWAIANIPNDDNSKKGLAFNHDKDDMFEACGVGINNGELADEYAKLRMSTPGDKKSEFIEHLEANGSLALIRSLVIRGVYSVEQRAEEKKGEVSSELDALLALIKKLK